MRKMKSDDLLTQDLVRTYLDDIGRFPLLTKESEASLARRIEFGRDARRDLDRGEDLAPSVKAKLRRAVADGEREALAAAEAADRGASGGAQRPL